MMRKREVRRSGKKDWRRGTNDPEAGEDGKNDDLEVGGGDWEKMTQK